MVGTFFVNPGSHTKNFICRGCFSRCLPLMFQVQQAKYRKGTASLIDDCSTPSTARETASLTNDAVPVENRPGPHHSPPYRVGGRDTVCPEGRGWWRSRSSGVNGLQGFSHVRSLLRNAARWTVIPNRGPAVSASTHRISTVKGSSSRQTTAVPAAMTQPAAHARCRPRARSPVPVSVSTAMMAEANVSTARTIRPT